MKANRVMMIVGAALVCAAVPAVAKDKAAPKGKTATKAAAKSDDYMSWEEREKRRQAQLRAEANYAGPTREEWARVHAVLAARKARENRELARYEEYKMEQKVRLAEASSAKTYVFINGGPGGDPATTPAKFQRTAVTTISQPDLRKSADSVPLPPIGEKVRASGSSGHPDRFARRSAQEEALDRQDSRLDEQARSDAQALLNAPPFGVPVPGRPGYISSPPTMLQGYIDVREFSPGSVVVDPFTGQRLRVP